jgi:hypothetical protein
MQYAEQPRVFILNALGALIALALAAVAVIESLFAGLLNAVREELAATQARRRPGPGGVDVL